MTPRAELSIVVDTQDTLAKLTPAGTTSTGRHGMDILARIEQALAAALSQHEIPGAPPRLAAASAKLMT